MTFHRLLFFSICKLLMISWERQWSMSNCPLHVVEFSLFPVYKTMFFYQRNIDQKFCNNPITNVLSANHGILCFSLYYFENNYSLYNLTYGRCNQVFHYPTQDSPISYGHKQAELKMSAVRTRTHIITQIPHDQIVIKYTTDKHLNTPLISY